MEFVGSRRGGVPVEWRRLHNEEIYVLLFTQNAIRVTKSGRLRRTERVAVWETREMHTVWWMGT